MNTLTMPLFGSHFMILFGGMSEKTRNPLFLIQQQPSAQSKPEPSTSIDAPGGTSLSNSGSRRSIEPMVFGVWELAVVPVIRKTAQAQSAAVRNLDMIDLFKENQVDRGLLRRTRVYQVKSSGGSFKPSFEGITVVTLTRC